MFGFFKSDLEKLYDERSKVFKKRLVYYEKHSHALHDYSYDDDVRQAFMAGDKLLWLEIQEFNELIRLEEKELFGDSIDLNVSGKFIMKYPWFISFGRPIPICDTDVDISSTIRDITARTNGFADKSYMRNLSVEEKFHSKLLESGMLQSVMAAKMRKNIRKAAEKMVGVIGESTEEYDQFTLQLMFESYEDRNIIMKRFDHSLMKRHISEHEDPIKAHGLALLYTAMVEFLHEATIFNIDLIKRKLLGHKMTYQLVFDMVWSDFVHSGDDKVGKMLRSAVPEISTSDLNTILQNFELEKCNDL